MEENKAKPIIGILCQPSSEKHHECGFTKPQYIFPPNPDYIDYGDGVSVRIPIDLAEDKLIALLDQINGVLFTGGFTKLLEDDGTLTPYMKAARIIYNYCQKKKDEDKEDWPILGICQGYEVIGILNNDDKLSILDNVKIFGKSRPVKWEVDPSTT